MNPNAVPVNIRTRFDGNRVMGGIADQLCGFGNKQAVGNRLTLQRAVQKHALSFDRSQNIAFDADHQFFAADIAFDITVHV